MRNIWQPTTLMHNNKCLPTVKEIMVPIKYWGTILCCLELYPKSQHYFFQQLNFQFVKNTNIKSSCSFQVAISSTSNNNKKKIWSCIIYSFLSHLQFHKESFVVSWRVVRTFIFLVLFVFLFFFAAVERRLLSEFCCNWLINYIHMYSQFRLK
jgi:hypothetical protein